RITVGWRRVFPICLHGFPTFAQSFFIGIAVLRNNRSDALGVANRQAKAGRGAVVKHIHGEAPETDHLRKTFHHLRDVVKGVGEAATVGHVRLSETRQVRRDKVETVSKRGNQIAKHVARSWKTVKEEEGRWVRPPRFSIKYVETINVDLAVAGFSHIRTSVSGTPGLR